MNNNQIKIIKKTMYYLLAIILIIIIFSSLVFVLSIIPPRITTSKNPSVYNLDYEEVEYLTKDNIKIRAWFIPNNKTNATIIIGHGYPFSKDNVLIFASFLVKEYNLLFFDFRSFGESQGRITTVGLKETKDFEASVEYLKSRKELDSERIGAIGFSMSASVFLMSDTKVSAIVAESPYANLDNMVKQSYRMFPGPTKYPFVLTTRLLSKIFFNKYPSEISPAESIKNKQIPILLISGDRDREIPFENTVEIYENSNKETTELWIIKDAGHGQVYFIKGKEYEDKILNFFRKNI